MTPRNRFSKVGEAGASEGSFNTEACIKDHHQKWASSLGVPLAYLYADNSDLAEVILAFGLLPEREQRRLAVELKARVSPPAAKTRAARRAPAARRAR